MPTPELHHILQIHDTHAELNDHLDNNQIAIETDSNFLAYRDDTGVYHLLQNQGDAMTAGDITCDDLVITTGHGLTITDLTAGILMATSGLISAITGTSGRLTRWSDDNTIAAATVTEASGALGGITTLAMTGALTGAASYNGLVVTPNTGAITTGSWHGTVIDADHGGTGQTVYAVGDMLTASTTTALSKLADVAVGSVLTSGGVGVIPAWSTTIGLGVSKQTYRIIDSDLTTTYCPVIGTGGHNVVGIEGAIAWNPTANATDVSFYGLEFFPTLTGTQNVVDIIGTGSTLSIGGSGSISRVIGAMFHTRIVSTTRTASSYYQLYGSIGLVSGSALAVTTAFQLYLTDYSTALSATTKYGIYQAGAFTNYLEGNVGIIGSDFSTAGNMPNGWTTGAYYLATLNRMIKIYGVNNASYYANTGIGFRYTPTGEAYGLDLWYKVSDGVGDTIYFDSRRNAANQYILFRGKTSGTAVNIMKLNSSGIVSLDHIAELTASHGVVFDNKVGIGGTPVAGTVLDMYGAFPIVQLTPTTPTQYASYQVVNGGNILLVGLESSAGGTLLASAAAYSAVINCYGERNVHIGTHNIIRMTFAANGAIDTTGSFTVATAFGCNGKTAQTAYTVNAACTDLPTVVALCNQLRAALVANGIAV